MKPNKQFYFLVFFLLLLSDVFSQNQLTIKINSLKNNNGVVWLVLYDADEKIVHSYSVKIMEKSATLIIDSLAEGRYSFKYFHDENNNKELDTNWLRIPKEVYGFSNNAKGKFGPPKFEETIFDAKKDTTLICYPTYLFN